MSDSTFVRELVRDAPVHGSRPDFRSPAMRNLEKTRYQFPDIGTRHAGRRLRLRARRIANGVIHSAPALHEYIGIVLSIIREMAREPLDDLVAGASALARGGEGPVGEFEVQKQPVLEAGVRESHCDARRTTPSIQGGQLPLEIIDRGIAPVVIKHAVDFVPTRIVPQLVSRTFP